MNFSEIRLDEAQTRFANELDEFFRSHVTQEVLFREKREGSGFNEDVHLAMGERGWVTPTWPRSDGGAGLNELELRLLHEAVDRSGLSISLSSTTDLPVLAVRAFAGEPLKSEVLAGVASGQIRICLGYTEPDCGSDLAAVRTRARREGGEWVIDGQKMFTTGAQDSQYCFCLTRTDPEAAKHSGLTVFLVPLEADGIEIKPIRTLGGERTNFVHFDNVRVADRFRIGPEGGGWEVLAAPLAAEHGRGDVGNLRPIGSGSRSFAIEGGRALRLLLNYLRVSGTLNDCTVRERLVRLELGVEACAVTPGNLARVLSSDAVVAAMTDLLEACEGLGLLSEGSEGCIGHGVAEAGFRYAPGTAIYGGTLEIHRNLIATGELGLPRPR